MQFTICGCCLPPNSHNSHLVTQVKNAKLWPHMRTLVGGMHISERQLSRFGYVIRQIVFLDVHST